MRIQIQRKEDKLKIFIFSILRFFPHFQLKADIILIESLKICTVILWNQIYLHFFHTNITTTTMMTMTSLIKMNYFFVCLFASLECWTKYSHQIGIFPFSSFFCCKFLQSKNFLQEKFAVECRCLSTKKFYSSISFVRQEKNFVDVCRDGEIIVNDEKMIWQK